MSVMLRRSLASLVIVALLLFATVSVAAAQPQRVAVSGSFSLYFTAAPTREWGADGWIHFQGDPLAGTFALSGEGVSLSGTVSRLDHGKYDAPGDGTIEGTITFVDANTGVTCQGPSNGKLASYTFRGSVNARCSDGSRLQLVQQDTEPLFDSQGILIGVTGTFSGTLLIPGG